MELRCINRESEAIDKIDEQIQSIMNAEVFSQDTNESNYDSSVFPKRLLFFSIDCLIMLLCILIYVFFKVIIGLICSHKILIKTMNSLVFFWFFDII